MQKQKLLHLIIKKDYAAAIIEHLRKEEAIEVIEEDTSTIPEWQKDAVHKTPAHLQAHPEQLQSWDIVKKNTNAPDFFSAWLLC